MTVEDRVCNLIQERRKLGFEKYGTTMERTDLSEKEWLQHAQEEALDFAIYLEKLKTTGNVLSEDDMLKLLAYLEVQRQENECWVGADETAHLAIEKKLQDVINLV